jgi:hypothetical protein
MVAVQNALAHSVGVLINNVEKFLYK